MACDEHSREAISHMIRENSSARAMHQFFLRTDLDFLALCDSAAVGARDMPDGPERAAVFTTLNEFQFWHRHFLTRPLDPHEDPDIATRIGVGL